MISLRHELWCLGHSAALTPTCFQCFTVCNSLPYYTQQAGVISNHVLVHWRAVLGCGAGRVTLIMWLCFALSYPEVAEGRPPPAAERERQSAFNLQDWLTSHYNHTHSHHAGTQTHKLMYKRNTHYSHTPEVDLKLCHGYPVRSTYPALAISFIYAFIFKLFVRNMAITGKECLKCHVTVFAVSPGSIFARVPFQDTLWLRTEQLKLRISIFFYVLF